VASRRDELRAHQFLKQRAVSALVIHETDPEQPPFRRPTLAMYWGIALTLLGLAVAGAIGLFSHHSALKLEAGKTVVVESGTGATFVYLGGQLHPVPNYTSALLVLGDHVPTQTVSRGDLLGIPRGTAVGIAGAPDDLPDRNHLLPGAWSMCSRPMTSTAGERTDEADLLVGSVPGGGTQVSSRAVLAVAAGHEYLLWNGYRHQLSDRRVATAGLGLASEATVPVAPAWITVLPAGPDVAPVPVRGAGGPSRALPSRPDTRAGELFVVTVSDAVRQYYLALGDRLVPLTPFQLALQLAAPDTARAYPGHPPRPILLDPAAVTLADQASAPVAPSDLPRSRPGFVQAGPMAAMCAGFDPGSAVPRLLVGSTLPSASAGLANGGGTGRGGAPLADRIVVPPGRGALVTVIANAKAAAGTLALVTDAGRLFPLAGADVAKTLGYAGVTPVRVAASVAARIPLGPALDPAVAREPN